MNGGHEFRLVRPSPQQAMTGIQVLCGGNADLMEGFLAYARQQSVELTRQVIAVSGDAIAGMCLWVPSPGKTALLFTPRIGPDSHISKAATALAVEEALREARQFGVTLVQAMLEPADTTGIGLFTSAGLTSLAQLIYMERQPPMLAPQFELPTDVLLEPYSESAHALFRQAILGSYEQTLDCPALSGLRDVEDVITGHKNVGLFDPQLWSVVLEKGQAIGCLLLAEVPARKALELVYLGLMPAARGRRLGRVLMNRVLAIGSRRRFAVMSLAVDTLNKPALALYRRCGFRRVAERVAMIKKL